MNIKNKLLILPIAIMLFASHTWTMENVDLSELDSAPAQPRTLALSTNQDEIPTLKELAIKNVIELLINNPKKFFCPNDSVSNSASNLANSSVSNLANGSVSGSASDSSNGLATGSNEALIDRLPESLRKDIINYLLSTNRLINLYPIFKKVIDLGESPFVRLSNDGDYAITGSLQNPDIRFWNLKNTDFLGYETVENPCEFLNSDYFNSSDLQLEDLHINSTLLTLEGELKDEIHKRKISPVFLAYYDRVYYPIRSITSLTNQLKQNRFATTDLTKLTDYEKIEINFSERTNHLLDMFPIKRIISPNNRHIISLVPDPGNYSSDFEGYEDAGRVKLLELYPKLKLNQIAFILKLLELNNKQEINELLEDSFYQKTLSSFSAIQRQQINDWISTLPEKPEITEVARITEGARSNRSLRERLNPFNWFNSQARVNTTGQNLTDNNQNQNADEQLADNADTQETENSGSCNIS